MSDTYYFDDWNVGSDVAANGASSDSGWLSGLVGLTGALANTAVAFKVADAKIDVAKSQLDAQKTIASNNAKMAEQSSLAQLTRSMYSSQPVQSFVQGINLEKIAIIGALVVAAMFLVKKVGR